MCDTRRMHDVSVDTDHLELVPVYVSVEPRDPRGDGAVSEDAIEHVPSATSDEVADVLLQLGIPAEVLDGAVLGAPGWIVARTLGWSDGRVLRWAPDENPVSGPYPSLTRDDVATYLGRALDVACSVGEELELPDETHGDDEVGLVIHRRSGAVVGHLRPMDAPHLARAAGAALWFTTIDGASIVAAVDATADLGAVATYPSRSAQVGLERNGAWRRMGIMRDGTVLAAHEWGPRWTRVEPSEGVDPEADVTVLVLDFYDPPRADPLPLAREFGLGAAETAQLQGLLDDADRDDPFTDVLRLLGLPEEAAEVAEGWLDPADLPGVRHVVPQTLVRSMWSSLVSGPSEDGVLEDVRRLWGRAGAARWVLGCVGGLALGVTAVAVIRRTALRPVRHRTARPRA